MSWTGDGAQWPRETLSRTVIQFPEVREEMEEDCISAGVKLGEDGGTYRSRVRPR